jgi:hypothetical protein
VKVVVYMEARVRVAPARFAKARSAVRRLAEVRLAAGRLAYSRLRELKLTLGPGVSPAVPGMRALLSQR